MRLPSTQDYALPRPGTTEAIELGCTCRLIAHEAKADEAEPAGLLVAPDPSCPIHGTAAPLEEHE